jgi:hypothetical protein
MVCASNRGLAGTLTTDAELNNVVPTMTAFTGANNALIPKSSEHRSVPYLACG